MIGLIITWIVLSELMFVFLLFLGGTEGWFGFKINSFIAMGFITFASWGGLTSLGEDPIHWEYLLYSMGIALVIGLFILGNWGIVKLVKKYE